jgi:hypothetical protein
MWTVTVGAYPRSMAGRKELPPSVLTLYWALWSTVAHADGVVVVVRLRGAHHDGGHGRGWT